MATAFDTAQGQSALPLSLETGFLSLTNKKAAPFRERLFCVEHFCLARGRFRMPYSKG